MKRFLCILLCLLLAAPAALAEDYTPFKTFRQQFVTGGGGLRGSANLTVSGVAEWLDVLLPFTAAKLRVRIIGEAQGEMSDMLTDDDDWQIQLYVKDSNDVQRGITWIYGNPDGLYIQSELLPDTLLTLPVKDVNLPFQLTDGELLPLLNALDPMGLMLPDESGNAEIYSALAELSTISEVEWAENWAPVLEKYDVEVDVWLSQYASATVVSGATGEKTLRTAYEIPAEDLKAQMKYIISAMLNDYDLQSLLAPYFTDAQRSLYLNTAMLWFYDYCIDMLPLEGDIVLEREMTMLGETRAMTISLPLPQLPGEVTEPIGQTIADLFQLPYADVLEGVNHISIRQEDGELSVSLTSPARTLSLMLADAVVEGENVTRQGFLRITPAADSEDPPLSAALTWRSAHSIWQDEDYTTHEEFAWALAAEADLSLMAEDDPFRSRYVDFTPVSFTLKLGFSKADKEGASVQLTADLNVVLPGAELGLTGSVKPDVAWAHTVLPTTGGENLLEMSDERRTELRETLIRNAVTTMTTLNEAAQ